MSPENEVTYIEKFTSWIEMIKSSIVWNVNVILDFVNFLDLLESFQSAKDLSLILVPFIVFQHWRKKLLGSDNNSKSNWRERFGSVVDRTGLFLQDGEKVKECNDPNFRNQHFRSNFNVFSIKLLKKWDVLAQSSDVILWLSVRSTIQTLTISTMSSTWISLLSFIASVSSE